MIDLKKREELEKAAACGPWDEDWCRGAVRHIDRNVDTDSFYSGDNEDPLGWGRYDGPMIAYYRNDAAEVNAWIREAVRLMERATDYLHLPGTQELSRQLSEHVKKIQL